MPKTVFTGHPVSGDIEGNIEKVVKICSDLHSEHFVPVFPSFTTRRYLTPEPQDRILAHNHILEYFKRKFIDEVWLYGDRISEGMKREILWAHEFGIPVMPRTRETAEALGLLLTNKK